MGKVYREKASEEVLPEPCFDHELKFQYSTVLDRFMMVIFKANTIQKIKPPTKAEKHRSPTL